MLVIVIISLIMYIIAGIMIYTNTYYLEKDKRIKFIIIGFLCVLLITFIIVAISSIGIEVENKNYLVITRRTSTLLFAPINSILILPYLGNVLNKYKSDALHEKQVKRRFIIISILAIVIILFEIQYIKNFEIGLIKNAIK